ncbi:glycosyltransferase [Mycolicibacterium chlorophenolicum]|uniref:4'-demethylrebeccamycin synthase n=1 Tax=Mycolicibacterium chlorophenolicum TaxID=37916 RepID=A0A0J6VPC6_9MYCO|nr:glycosyltransferase [Mycolicibacterium chlorophenolicum]KMO71999.1 4'-demethylrebeccamycin synthase [Mycolicibacterium chlorophenolicum]
MAVVLAYTSPALGHLFPFCALLTELASRGHQVHLRTLAAGVDLARELGFTAAPVHPGIEALQSIDPFTDSMMRSVASTVEVLTRRAVLEVGDFQVAVRDVEPDVMVLDANCWGAMAAAEAQTRPWVVLSPFVPYLRSPGSPPFGAGAAPMRGPVGRVRDWGIGLVTVPLFDRPLARGMRPVREALGLAPLRSADDLLRRAPGLLVATGKPFEYEHTDWGASASMIGPAAFDPPLQRPPAWLDDIDLPVVLVTTSSVRQADEALIRATIDALDGQPVHVVATSPAGDADAVQTRRGVTMARFVPHSAVLERAVCVVTHGGMGVTQKALGRGIPVCAVPFGRDQFEVARRVQVARCGTRLPARRLSVPRLREAIGAAMTMTAGAQAVAAGFAATGGVRRGADIVESHLTRRS